MDIITAAAPDDPTLPFAGPRGFSDADLVGLFFMDGSDTVASIINHAGGAPTATATTAGGTAAWSSATMMANGGIQLRGNTYLLGATVDITTDWTMFAHLAVGLPTNHDSITTFVSPMLSTDQYINNKGVIMYASIGSYPTAATPLNPAHRWMNSGAQAAPVVIGAPLDVTYTLPLTFALSYAAGNLRSRIFRAGVKIAEKVSAVTIANVANGVPNQKPVVGTPQQNYAEANLLCEVFGIYDRELTDNDLVTTDLMSIAVRQGRGR